MPDLFNQVPRPPKPNTVESELPVGYFIELTYGNRRIQVALDRVQGTTAMIGINNNGHRVVTKTFQDENTLEFRIGSDIIILGTLRVLNGGIRITPIINES